MIKIFQRKKNNRLILRCFDRNNNLIQSVMISELVPSENYILKISHDEYQNDEPCIVTRSAITGNLLNEFQKHLTSNMEQSCEFQLSELPAEFLEGIAWEPDIVKIRAEKI